MEQISCYRKMPTPLFASEDCNFIFPQGLQQYVPSVICSKFTNKCYVLLRCITTQNVFEIRKSTQRTFDEGLRLFQLLLDKVKYSNNNCFCSSVMMQLRTDNCAVIRLPRQKHVVHSDGVMLPPIVRGYYPRLNHTGHTGHPRRQTRNWMCGGRLKNMLNSWTRL